MITNPTVMPLVPICDKTPVSGLTIPHANYCNTMSMYQNKCVPSFYNCTPSISLSTIYHCYILIFKPYLNSSPLPQAIKYRPIKDNDNFYSDHEIKGTYAQFILSSLLLLCTLLLQFHNCSKIKS